MGDAPARYVDGQLGAIVGISMRVTDVQAKAKLSQNRSEADQAGVVAGLRASDDRGAEAVAYTMETLSRNRLGPAGGGARAPRRTGVTGERR